MGYDLILYMDWGIYMSCQKRQRLIYSRFIYHFAQPTKFEMYTTLLLSFAIPHPDQIDTETDVPFLCITIICYMAIL